MKRLAFAITVALLALAAGLNVFGGAHAATPAAGAAQPWAGRISVVVVGNPKGPDVVLIPGLTSSRAVWDQTVKQLEGRYRLHLVQVNGFAGAPAGDNATGPVLQPVVDAIDAYIKANHLKNPAVVGHSLGGLAGLMLASQHPEDIGRLMVVDSLPYFAVLMMGPTATPDAVAASAGGFRDQLKGASNDQYAAMETRTMASLAKDPAGRALALQWALDSDHAVVAQAMYDDITTDMRPALSGIKVPVTMVYPWDGGGRFAQADTDAAYGGAYAALPGVKMVRVDGAYHYLMLDNPVAFAAVVEGFLH